jgi:NADPH-dependent ferric siderophore reductase
MSQAELAVSRVRHPLKFRLLEVKRVEPVSPQLVRVTFSGDDLDDFVSASFDDHVKLFFPSPGLEQPALPTLGPDGAIVPPADGRTAIARNYTPRRYDRAARELEIEFVLHEAGPATQWAAQARPGQTLGIGGPRGSLVIPTGFDWHLLVGDETALPAIARRLEELPAGTHALVVLEVASRDCRIPLASAAATDVVWCYRDEATAGESPLLAAVRNIALPAGEGYAWVAAEAAVTREVRQHLAAERGLAKSRIRAAAYWKQGSAAVHETLDD